MRIGIDLGGTKTEVIALSERGEQRYRHRLPTPRDYQQTIENIAHLVALAEEATGQTGTVGVGIPGDGRSRVAEPSNSPLPPRQRLSSYEQILVAAAEARKKHDARWRRSRRLDMPDASSALGSPSERKPDQKQPREGGRPFPPDKDFGR